MFIKLAAIGDAILLIPTLRKLKQSFPDASITFMCSDINRAIIEKIPYADKIINCEVYSFLKNPLNFVKFISNLRKVKYDVIIDAGQWERINSVITCFARKEYSIGFRTSKQYKHLINDSAVYHSKTKHELENFMDLLVPLGIGNPGWTPTYDELQLEYFLKQEDRDFRDKFWKENNLINKKVICLHPGCGEHGKPREWYIDNYSELAQKIFEYDNNVRFLLTGTMFEKYLCDNIHEKTKSYSFNTAGQFSLDQTAALVEKADLMICSNTGILHISTCVGTRTIGLHGPTNPVKWGAYSQRAKAILSNKFCSPCLYLGHDYGCKNPDCMTYITPDEVFSEVRKVLNNIN